MRSHEQEAYDNMEDIDYLQNRKIFAWLRKYMTKRKNIYFNNQGYLVIDRQVKAYKSEVENAATA